LRPDLPSLLSVEFSLASILNIGDAS